MSGEKNLRIDQMLKPKSKSADPTATAVGAAVGGVPRLEPLKSAPEKKKKSPPPEPPKSVPAIAKQKPADRKSAINKRPQIKDQDEISDDDDDDEEDEDFDPDADDDSDESGGSDDSDDSGDSGDSDDSDEEEDDDDDEDDEDEEDEDDEFEQSKKHIMKFMRKGMLSKKKSKFIDDEADGGSDDEEEEEDEDAVAKAKKNIKRRKASAHARKKSRKETILDHKSDSEGSDMEVDTKVAKLEDEGDQLLESMIENQPYENSELGDLEAHDLEHGQEKRTNYNEEEICDTEWYFIGLFYDKFTHYLFKERDKIASGRIAGALQDELLDEMRKALARSKRFIGKLTELRNNMYVAIEQLDCATRLGVILHQLRNAKHPRMAPLQDMIKLQPTLGDKKFDEARYDLITQKEIASNKGVFLQLYEMPKKKVCNSITSSETMSSILAIFFIENVVRIVRAETRKWFHESVKKDPYVLQETLINKYLHADTKQTIPMISNFFIRQLKHLAILMPHMVIPKIMQRDLD